MNEKSLKSELIGEMVGTFILVLLGDGVVANVGLAPRSVTPVYYNWNTIAIGWCFAVIMAVYVAGGVSGAHLNPAVTLGLASKRGFPWPKVLPYMIAQVAGGFLGALGVYLVYRDGLVSAGLPNVWTTGPGSIFGQAFFGAAGSTALGSYSMLTAAVAEFFGTTILIWAVLASGDSKNMGLMHNLSPFLVGFAVLAVGMSLSGPSGYSLNPARDFGPRLLGVVIGTQGLFDGLYWLIPPVLVPLLTGPIAVFFYDLFITSAFKEKETHPVVAPRAAGK
jgi:glycerol uptake facilitator protein